MTSRPATTLIALSAVALAACSATLPTAGRSPAAAGASPSATSAVVSPTATPAVEPGVSLNSGGVTSSQIETTSDGVSPVRVSGGVSAPNCAVAIGVRLTLSVSRDGRPLPGDGTVLNLTRCGPFSQDLHPGAGRVRVRADALATGGASVDLTVASAGQVSHSSVGGDGGNGNASAISIN